METAIPDIWPTFSDWWDLYGYKLDRVRCERMWSKMSQQDKEKAMQHTERYVAATFTDGRFPSRRHPGTYLYNANWNDEPLIRSLPPARETSPAGSAMADKGRRAAEDFLRSTGGAEPVFGRGDKPR